MRGKPMGLTDATVTWTAFRRASRRLLKRVKLASFSLVVVSLCTTPQSALALVTATVTGTVSSGIDQTGVFGVAGADLTGSNYTLVYTIDDTNQQVAADEAYIQSTDNSNPVMAVLTINGQSITFGTPPFTSLSSYARRFASAGNAQVYFASLSG